MTTGIARPILHLLNGEQYSGLERVVDHLVDAAPEHNYRLHLGLLKPLSMTSRMKSRRGVEHEIGMRSRLHLAIARRAREIALAQCCKLVHSHTVRGALVAAQLQWSTKLPWVHHIHSPALRESSRVVRNMVNFIAEAATLWRADAVIAVSEAMAEYASAFYRIPRKRIRIVPNGVVTPFQIPAPATKSAERTISVIGLFRPRKGIGVLLDAVALLRKRGYQFSLRVVGEFSEPSYERDVRHQVATLGIEDVVHFVGFETRVEAELARCNIFAFPSLYGEGLPVAVLEAMAWGRPIVASDIPGIRELLRHDVGILVPPGDPLALAGAIQRLLNEPALADALGSLARERQLTNYSVADMVSSVFAIYDEFAPNDASSRFFRL